MKTQRTDKQRFWDKVNKSEEACWEWSGGRSRLGYGVFHRKGVGAISAHRYSWAMANGQIYDGLHVLHRCDNPSCVRPDHLFLGTHQDNMRDRTAKNRGARIRGSANATAKLSEADVETIDGMLRSGLSATQVARAMSLTRACVQSIKAGTTWSHLTGRRPGIDTVTPRKLMVTIAGRDVPFTAACAESGVPYKTAVMRVSTLGWTALQAVATPVRGCACGG